MEKLIYLLGDAPAGQVPRARGDLRNRLLGAAPALAAAGALRATATVADLDDPLLDQVAQFNPSGLLDATLSVWLDSLDERTAVDDVVAPLAARNAAYLVTESVPRAWADRDWADGERSPGVALVTTFDKPEALADEDFYARWHGSHTPLSLEIHPLLEYVRNAVARPLCRDAPRLRAIVSESVASLAIAADPEQFYSSEAGRKRAVKDLMSFVHFPSLNTVWMSEYILMS